MSTKWFRKLLCLKNIGIPVYEDENCGVNRKDGL